jgi:hypothetical protein
MSSIQTAAQEDVAEFQAIGEGALVAIFHHQVLIEEMRSTALPK